MFNPILDNDFFSLIVFTSSEPQNGHHLHLVVIIQYLRRGAGLRQVMYILAIEVTEVLV